MSDFDRLARLAQAQQREIELLRTLLFADKPEQEALEQLRALETLNALDGYPCGTDLCGHWEHGPLVLPPSRECVVTMTTAPSIHFVLTRVCTDPRLHLRLRKGNYPVARGAALQRLFLWVPPNESLDLVARNPTAETISVMWPPELYGFQLHE